MDPGLENPWRAGGWGSRAGLEWRMEACVWWTLAFGGGARIEKSNGETGTSLDTARQFAECPDIVAAALWVLRQAGRL